jgi:hypothetical protein
MALPPDDVMAAATLVRGACADSRNKPVWKCRNAAGNDEFVFAYTRLRAPRGSRVREAAAARRIHA